MVVDAGVS